MFAALSRYRQRAWHPTPGERAAAQNNALARSADWLLTFVLIRAGLPPIVATLGATAVVYGLRYLYRHGYIVVSR